MKKPGCFTMKPNDLPLFISKNRVAVYAIAALFIFLTCIPQSHAQKKTRIRIIEADQLQGIQSGKEELNIFTGNVIFEHDSAFLYCDSAVLFSEQNSLEAHRNVRVKISDTLNLYGDFLFYDGNTRVATMTGNVVLEDNDATLYTERLIYERNSAVAYYYSGGRIINEDNELTSIKGYYDTEQKQVFFQDSVQLVNPEYLLRSDTLIYHTATEIAFISGPTTIRGEDEFLYSEKGLYNTKTDYTRLELNSYMTYKEQYLSGDSIVYEKASGVGEAFGNVFLKDTVQGMIVTGEYADYRRKSGYAYATDSAEVIMMDKTDSLFMHADTLWLKFDSTESPEKLLAYHRCKFYKTDLQGMSDSLVYSFADSTITMHFRPVLWTQENQLSAELITVFTSNQRADSMHMTNSSFIISQDEYDTLQFNQIKGKSMVAYFEKNELHLVTVNGNSETIYFVRQEDGGLIGINKAVASSMEIWITDRQVEDIYYFDSPDAQLYPRDELPADQYFLRDFRWRRDDRPESRFDIFQWPEDAPGLR